jgi:hypothetical protein
MNTARASTEPTETQYRAALLAALRTLTAWLAARDLPQVPWEVTAGAATANLGESRFRWDRATAGRVLESYAAALGTRVEHVEVSEHDGHPAEVLTAKVPLDTAFPFQQNLEIEMYYVLAGEGDD